MGEYQSMDAMRHMVDAWKADARKLKEKAANAHEDAQGDLQAEREHLEERRKNLEARLDEVQDDSGEAWRDLKDGVSRASSELNDALSRAAARMG